MTELRRIFAPWTYGYLVATVMWVVVTAYAGIGNGGDVLMTATFFAAISVVVAIGQMFVVASGPGNIDLSIPSIMTLAAYVSMKVMDGHDPMILAGLAATLAVGAVAGTLNFLAIRALRIPPIIATLAWSFVFQSMAYDLGGEATLKPPPALASFTTMRLGVVPVMPVAVVLLTVAAGVVLTRGLWGRQLLAVGQNDRAAVLVNISVDRVRVRAYVFSSMAAALAGYLLSGFSGGAALNMGDTYMMESLAIVVLGGTAVTGGDARAAGLWGAALFFNLMASMLNTIHVDASYRLILMGLIIVGIVTITPQGRRA
jgi:ribose transport system permease protein